MNKEDLIKHKKINQIKLSSDIENWTEINLDALLPKTKNIKQVDTSLFSMLSKKDFQNIYISHNFLFTKICSLFTNTLLTNVDIKQINTYFFSFNDIKKFLAKRRKW